MAGLGTFGMVGGGGGGGGERLHPHIFVKNGFLSNCLLYGNPKISCNP